MLYKLINILKAYNNKTILDIKELNIEKGKIYALLGPNGAGKTSLLNILALLDAPNKGVIYYNDHSTDILKKQTIKFRKEIVMVDQYPIMFSTSVYKNVEFGLKMRKIIKEKRKERIIKALQLVGMIDFCNKDARYLSGGETRRVAIARAIACEPDVVIFDEPTVNIDYSTQIAIENFIKTINKQKNISIIFSTHDIFQANRLADKKIYINEGLLIDSEPVDFEMIPRYKL